MLHGEKDFDDAGNTCGRFQVANIWLKRAYSTVWFPARRFIIPLIQPGKCFDQGIYFNGVARTGASAVDFDITHGIGRDPGSFIGIDQ